MAFTRAQSSELLNKSEMKLFDDSRANALRGLDRAALAGRVERARAARDRARDLLKRQRLAARKRGEGKADGIAARTARKEAVLAEILQRFVDARREAPVAVAKKAGAANTASKKAATGKTSAKKVARKKAAKKSVAKKSAAKKATAKKAPMKKAATGKAATKKAPAKKAPAKKAVAKKPVAKKAPARKAVAKKAVAKKAAGKKAATRKGPAKKAAARTAATRRVSPQKALDNTRRLLEAKQERDRTPQPWQTLDPAADHVPQPGYQSPQAAGKAQELHAGEVRLDPIHGSISTRDRRNQGKRDHRNGGND